MALNPNVGAERAVVTWEVGPTKDVVQALIEILVDPRLPSMKQVAPGSLPSQVQQESVARQMHAVVVLYNYYHRKQKPELEFLDFLSFCNLAVVLRPNMVAFMKWTNECMSTEFNGTEDQLSITEKSIKDACDISTGLDASVDFPAKGDWPISKVSVLLIDSKGENCMLDFGAITEGVWSLFEKDLEKPRINQEISSESNCGEKRKRRRTLKSLVGDNELLQIVYDFVKETRGIEDYELKVLATHVTYSLTKEKSATQFYLVQAPASVKFTVFEEVPLRYLAESLQGPLATKSFGDWSATDVVSHYHMLPYTGFISAWLSQHKDLWSPSTNSDSAESIINVCSLENARIKISVPPALISPKQDPDCTDNNSSWMCVTSENNDEYHKKRRLISWGELPKSADKIQSVDTVDHAMDEVNEKHDETSGLKEDENVSLSGPTSGLSLEIERDDNVLTKFNRPPATHDSAKHNESVEAMSADKIQCVDTDNHAMGGVNQKHDESSGLKERENVSLSGPTSGFSVEIERDDNVLTKVNRLPATPDSAKHESTRNNIENLEATNVDVPKSLQSGRSKGQFQMTLATDNDALRFSKESNIMCYVIKEEEDIGPETSNREREACDYASLVAWSRYLESVCDSHGTSQNDAGTSKKLNSQLVVYHRRRKKLSSTRMENNGPDNGTHLNTELEGSSKMSHDNRCNDRQVSGQNGGVGISSDQSGTGKPVSQLCQQTTTKNIEAIQNLSASDVVQNDLALLYNDDEEVFGKNAGVGISADQNKTGKVVNQPCQIETTTEPIEVIQNVPASDMQNDIALLYNDDGEISGKNSGVGISADQNETGNVVNQHCQLETTTKSIEAIQNVPASDMQNGLVHLYNNDGKVPAQNGGVRISSDKKETGKAVNKPCQLETTSKPIEPIQNGPASGLVQSALALLYNKRHQQFSQICNYEDMLAQYEHYIERIRDNGEVGLALECTNSIVSGNISSIMKHGVERIKSPGKIFVPGTSKCEDLENMCFLNNWKLPKYIVEPSEGKFSSKVIFVSEKLELISKGGLETCPRKARESAAAQMIADICEHMGGNEAG